MSDYRANFIQAKKHHDSMGAALSKGDSKGAASAAGHVMKALHGKSPAAIAVAANPLPVGDDDMMVQRGFGPGLQFGKGSATGSPKPNKTGQGPAKKASSSIRARLSKMGKK